MNTERSSILVVEDILENQEFLKDLLEDHGYAVFLAGNGREGVDVARLNLPDLILMDINMPVMSGLDAIRVLKGDETTNRIPIIVLTGQNDTEDRIKAFECGALDFVAKPFDINELLAHVRSYLNYSRLNRKYVLSTRNPVTGLPNRAALKERLDEGQRVLMLLHLDGLPDITKLYGDEVGGRINRRFADFLLAFLALRAENGIELFHFDRSHFALAFPMDYATPHALKSFFEELQEQVPHSPHLEDIGFDLTLTITASTQADQALSQCEMALDFALADQQTFLLADQVTADLQEKISRNLTWLRKIREAVQNDRFVPYFQPILDIQNNRVTKYEALVRMADSDGGMIPPGAFLPVAMNSKYYSDLTKVMLRKTLATMKENPAHFSLNISARDIRDEETRAFLLNSFREHPELTPRLTLEMIEMESLVSGTDTKAFIAQAKKLGVSFAIDDFGSGYSNYKTLLELDIDYLKIDGSLIKAMLNDPASRDIVELITWFSHRNRLKVIAEFVENRDILNTLRALNVDFAQGYHIGAPAPAADWSPPPDWS